MPNQIKQLPLLIVIFVFFTSCRALLYNVPDVTDYKLFPYRLIEHDPESVFHFVNADTLYDLGKTIQLKDKYFMYQIVTLEDYLEITKTGAFIIIRNDSILYRKYNENFNENTVFNSFSVTKAFISTLVGIALMEGKIESVDQAITDFIPELLEKEGFSEITIKHLLVQTSGIKYSNQKYNPLSDNSKYYYGRKLRKYALNSELYGRPGVEFKYGSMNTQLLGLILERATGTTLSLYLQEKLWKKAGMQYDARWSMDSKREDAMEKCASNLCFTAIDLAKVGRLYLNKGQWDEEQIITETFIKEAIERDTTAGSPWDYQYNFRLSPKKYDTYFTRGLYGQLLFVYPQKNIIIVRAGEKNKQWNPPYFNQCILEILDQINEQ